jgi:hypothetical protein
MNERILIGLISGLVVSIGAWVWHSDFFTKTQKIIIFISLLFPPGALAVIILISIYNNVRPNKAAPNPTVTQPTKDLSVLEESLGKIKELHEKGIFTDSELNEKTSELEKQIRSIQEEKAQKSFESKVKESEEYRALLVLRSSQVISSEEFDKKVKKLIDDKMVESTAVNLDVVVDDGKIRNHDNMILGIVIVIILVIVYAAINS